MVSGCLPHAYTEEQAQVGQRGGEHQGGTMRRAAIAFAVLLLTAFAVRAQTQPAQPSPQQKHSLKSLPRVSITVLIDNMAGSGSVLGEWGVSFLVETDQHQILFDTGCGRALLPNSRALKQA